MLSYALHALKANVSQEEQEDRGSLVYRLYLRKPVKNKGGNSTTSPNNNPGLCIRQLRVHFVEETMSKGTTEKGAIHK